MMTMNELVLGEGAYVDSLRVRYVITIYICTLQLGLVTLTVFRATVSIICRSYFKIMTRLAKWSKE
jgi:hypothetical protein